MRVITSDGGVGGGGGGGGGGGTYNKDMDLQRVAMSMLNI